MRRYGLFFALLVVLAAAFLAAGTAMLNDSRYDLEVSGTVLAGERSDAGDVSIALDASLESRLKWSAGYDVSTGETVTDSSWDLIRSSGRDIELPSEPALVVYDVGLDMSYSTERYASRVRSRRRYTATPCSATAWRPGTGVPSG